MIETFKLVLAGAWISVLPLDFEANLLGMDWYRNSPLELVISLLAGIGIAWALKDDMAK